MIRMGFKMKLNPGQKNEYQSRHNKIWPELKNLLKDSGISDYVIFLDEETNILFASMKLNDPSIFNNLSDHPIMKKWWAYMKDIMETNPDNSPASKPLIEMFYLE